MICEVVLAGILELQPVPDPTWHDTYAEVVASAAASRTSDPALLGALVAVGRYESGWLPRIQAGKCEDWECDPYVGYDGKVYHQSRTFFQVKFAAARTVGAGALWSRSVGLEPENIDAAVEVAVRLLARGFRSCRSSRGAISHFATGRCGWTGATRRAVMAEAAQRKLEGCRPKE